MHTLTTHKTKQENNTKKKHREKLQQQHDRIMTRIIYTRYILMKTEIILVVLNTFTFISLNGMFAGLSPST